MELGNDGNEKNILFIFHTKNNYRINLSFQCETPLNPLSHSEFDLLDSLGKKT